MKISVYHVKQSLSRDERLSVTFPLISQGEPPRPVAAKRLFDRGGYEKVATVEGDLSYAWAVTNNVHGSWSRDPAKGVTVEGPGYVEFDGRRYGYKSSEVGDIFVNEETGEMLVVDGFGFTSLQE